MSRNTMQVEELLRELNLPSIKAVDQCGNTALHLTVKNKTFSQKTIVEVLEILLYIDINPNTNNKKNQTVSHLAVTYRMKDVINFLVSRKINMDFIPHFFIKDEYIMIQDFLGQINNLDEWHEEILRMQTESVDFVEWLISKGFDFDRKNQENKSPLNMAIKYNLQHVLPVLLNYTKDINFIDKDNKTLLHLFLQTNFTSTCYNAKSINKKWYAERYAADIFAIAIFIPTRGYFYLSTRNLSFCM